MAGSLSSGLDAWYKLDETDVASGSTWQSSVDTPAMDLTAKAIVASAAGKINTALSSSGGSAMLYASSAALLRAGSDDFTIAGWVKRSTSAAWSIPFGKWSAAADDREYTIFMPATTLKFQFYVSADGLTSTSVESTVSEVLNTWQFVCGRKSGTDLTLWVGDVRVEKASVPATLYASDARFSIAGSYDGTTVANTTSQAVDLVGHWGRALTDYEVSTLYNDGSGIGYPESAGSSLRRLLKIPSF